MAYDRRLYAEANDAFLRKIIPEERFEKAPTMTKPTARIAAEEETIADAYLDRWRREKDVADQFPSVRTADEERADVLAWLEDEAEALSKIADGDAKIRNYQGAWSAQKRMIWVNEIRQVIAAGQHVREIPE